MLCPHCANKLIKNPSHAHLVWQCTVCVSVSGIIVIEPPANNAISVELTTLESFTLDEIRREVFEREFAIQKRQSTE